MARMLETEKHRDPTGPDCTRDGAVKKATRGRTRHPGAHSGIRGSKAPLGSSFSRQPPEKMSEFLLSSLVLPIPLTNTRARLWFSLPKHRGIKGFLLRDRRRGEVSALEQWRWQVPRTDGARTALRDTQTRRKGFGGEGFRSRVGRETGRGQELQRRAVGTGGLQVSLKTTFSGESWRGLRSPVQGPSEKQPRRGWGDPHERHRREQGRTLPANCPVCSIFLPGHQGRTKSHRGFAPNARRKGSQSLLRRRRRGERVPQQDGAGDPSHLGHSSSARWGHVNYDPTSLSEGNSLLNSPPPSSPCLPPPAPPATPAC